MIMAANSGQNIEGGSQLLGTNNPEFYACNHFSSMPEMPATTHGKALLCSCIFKCLKSLSPVCSTSTFAIVPKKLN